MRKLRVLALALSGVPSSAAGADEAAEPEQPPAAAGTFEEGEVITFGQVGRLEPNLPPQFWKHRESFFFEAMKLESGPSFRQYGSSDAYQRLLLLFRDVDIGGAENAC